MTATRKHLVIRPLREEAAQARALGFRMRLHNDAKERVMRVELVAESDRAKRAVKVASQSSRSTGIGAGVEYSITDNKWDVAHACARVALERAREAL